MRACAFVIAGATLALDAAPAASPSPSATPGSGPAQEARPADPEPAPSPTPPFDCSRRPLDGAERDTLLGLAWRTLTGHLTDQPIRDGDLESFALTPCLLAPRGLFVTVKKGDQVRGRQGEMEPTRPLYQQVIVFTRRAATKDPRFAPLVAEDLGSLRLELSIIGERRRIDSPDDIHLDREGVFLEKWGRRALFLPRLASQRGWTAERTLDELCLEAALPRGSWSESARIEAFTTEEIAGGPPPAPSPQPSVTPALAAPAGDGARVGEGSRE